MATHAFKAGDLVILKSGGPTMTVTERTYESSVTDETAYWCHWFAGKKLERGRFGEKTLNAFDENLNG